MSNHIDTTYTKLSYVDPFPGQQDSERTFVDCGRCGGTGNVYSMVDGGVCYECNGHKGAWSTVGAERKRGKGKVAYANTKERKLVAKREFHNAQMIAAETAFPVLAAWSEEMATNSFLLDLWTKAFDYELSEKQIAAAAKSIQSRIDRETARAAEDADLTEVIEGKERITGTIVTVKQQDSAYGTTWKMLVLDDRNFKLWGTIPTAIFDQQREQAGEGVNPFAEDLKGRRVNFTATVSAKEAVTGFGFFKRPTKALLQAETATPAPEDTPAAEEATEAPAAPATVTATEAPADTFTEAELASVAASLATVTEGTALTHKDGSRWALVKVLSETHYSVADETGKVFRKRKSVFV